MRKLRFYSRDTLCTPVCWWYHHYGLKLRVKGQNERVTDLKAVRIWGTSCECSHRLSRALMAVSCCSCCGEKYCWNTSEVPTKMWLINPTTRPSDCCLIILLCWNIQRKGIKWPTSRAICAARLRRFAAAFSVTSSLSSLETGFWARAPISLRATAAY